MKKLEIFLTVLSLALLAGLFFFVDVGKVAATISKANPLLIIAALLAGFIGLSLRTLRWGLLVREKSAVPWKSLYAIQCAGMAVSHFSPGKVLEVVKALPLKNFGLSYSFSMITIVWERIFDLLVIFAFAFLAFPSLDANIRLALLSIFVLVVALALVSFRHLGKFFAVFSKLPFLGFLARVQSHSFKKRTIAASFLLTLSAWFFDAFAAFLAFKSLGMNIDFLLLTSSFFASIVVGIISFLPGGLGSTEAVFVFLLKSTGYPLASLLGGVLLARAFTLGVSAVVGFSLLPRVKN